MTSNQVSTPQNKAGKHLSIRKLSNTPLIQSRKFKELLRRLTPVMSLIIVIVVFTSLSDVFFSVRNFENISRQMAVLLICAAGETIVILAGMIDLSVGGVIALSAAIAAVTMPVIGGTGSFVLGIFVGAVIGFINGVVHAKMKVPSLIVTLGISVACYGIALELCQVPILTRDTSFRYLAKAQFGMVPLIWVVSILVCILLWLVLKYTILGRYIYAIGGDEWVVSMSGGRVSSVKIIIFAIAGACYGLGGVLMAGRLGASSAMLGRGWELEAIAAVVLGGNAITGGVGGIHKTILGVLIIVMLGSGLNIYGVSPWYQGVIKGVVLIMAVAATIDRSKIIIIK